MIDTAISNINTTISNINTTVYTAIANTTDETALSDLTSAIQGLLQHIQSQLDYHLPPPPTTDLPPPTTAGYLPPSTTTDLPPPPPTTTDLPPPPPTTTDLPPPPPTTTDLPPPTTTDLPPPPTTSTTPPPPPPPTTPDDPATSCEDLYDTPNASSGYYWIGEIGSAVRVYCSMNLTCGDLTGGWMRVANIDMTNTSQNCPSGLSLTSSPIRVCDITSAGCVSNDFDVHGAQYSHICGRVIGYQNSTPAAFYYHSRGIDADYVYGVSLTHGQSSREHIWTFAGAFDETSGYYRYKCPCINPNLDPTPTLPSFIGNDYFCDTAFGPYYNTVPNWRSIQVSDPLWDGEGCGLTNTCCYDPQRKVNPPWFVKTLTSPTSDDIEMRLCAGGSNTTPIEIVEIYVQ